MGPSGRSTFALALASGSLSANEMTCSGPRCNCRRDSAERRLPVASPSRRPCENSVLESALPSIPGARSISKDSPSQCQFSRCAFPLNRWAIRRANLWGEPSLTPRYRRQTAPERVLEGWRIGQDGARSPPGSGRTSEHPRDQWVKDARTQAPEESARIAATLKSGEGRGGVTSRRGCSPPGRCTSRGESTECRDRRHDRLRRSAVRGG